MSEIKKRPRLAIPPKVKQASAKKYVLLLFVSGILQNSVRAIENLNRICEEHIKDSYDLQIIDINQYPELAVSEQIIFIPVLIIKSPLPERRLIGDLSDTKIVLKFFNIE